MHYFILFCRYHTLRFQVCVDHGIVDHYIKTVGASCVELTREDYFTLPAARDYPRASRIDGELDSHEVAKGSPVSGCSSVAGRFVLHMRHH